MMSNATHLTAHLREFAPYLKEAGWRQSATLVSAAADEIEHLRQRVAQFEASQVLVEFMKDRLASPMSRSIRARRQ